MPGNMALLDTLALEFDYAGEQGGHFVPEGDDERQFIRNAGPKGRRVPAA